MDFIHEYGLLVAVATPVGVIALINLMLALGGEKGTLLLPSLRAYPPVLADAQQAVAVAEPEPAPKAVPVRPSQAPVTAGFDETDELLARQAA